MDHKELTKHLRKRLAKSGIKARCSMYDSCGAKWIKVSVPAFDVEFTEEEQREIRLIAKVNGLTHAQGLEIDIDQMTDPMQHTFQVPA
jgi:hypothetical protein